MTTLGRALTIAVAALLAISLAAAAALVVLTSRLHRTTARLGAAMENVQLAEESLVDLRAIDAMAARMDGGDRDERLAAMASRGEALRDRLAEIERRTQAPSTRRLLVASQRSVERYVAAAGADESASESSAEMRRAFDEALETIRRFLELNVSLARRERATAARWDRAGDVWGLGAAALLVFGTLAVLALLRARLFNPMFALAGSISRYGRGDRSERAPEAGFDELREIARSFNQVADRLERQRDDQLAFLAGVAHDLRSPLAAISLASRSHSGVPTDPDRVRSRLEMIERQVKKLDRLAADFLDAARAEAGQLEITLEPHDLRGVARAVAELFSGTSREHRLEVSEPAHPLIVQCDIGRIEQVVNNLVGNAIKYSPDGGRIRITLRQDAGDAVFSIADQGVGIAPDDLTRIFEPFRRGSRLTRVVPGLGLGLATSRRIAERHGGSLTVSSVPGNGSTFELRLPLRARGSLVAAAP